MIERNDPAEQNFFIDVFDNQAFGFLEPNQQKLLRKHAVTRVNLWLNDLDQHPDISNLRASRKLCEEAGISRGLVFLTEKRVEDAILEGANTELREFGAHFYGVVQQERVERSL